MEGVPESVLSEGMIVVILLSKNPYQLTAGLSLLCLPAVLDSILRYPSPCLGKLYSVFSNVTLLLQWF